MKTRKTALALAVAGLLGFSGAASALTIDGITFEAGATFETMDLFEGEDLAYTALNPGLNGNGNGVIDQPGERLVGIGIVNRILDINNNILWQNGQNGRELTIHLFGFTAENVSVTAVPGLSIANIAFTGGFANLYSDSTLNFSAAGTQAQGIARATDGNLFLSLSGSAAGGFGGFSGQPITLTSTALTATGGNPLLASTNLTGQSLLDVTGGAAAGNFNTNTFGCVASDGAPCPNDADLKITSSGQLTVPTGQQAWGFRGTGEASSFVVPAPGSLALLGLGLAGLGFSARRKAAKA